MCGILGLYNLNKDKKIKEELFSNSLNVMRHRGPNNQSYKKINNNLYFGHVRLSIIDLNENSNQPFSDDTGNYSIVFNGEIFNYLEIKSELENLGHLFRTNSDTEVLLHSFIEWGEECVLKLNGMWAFAIYDTLEDKLFCSRDRFGIKPFNYTLIDGQFIFASEIKAIISYFPTLKVPNYNVIANYCRSSTGAQIKETWFEDIYRLEPAHNLVIDSSGVKIKRYWDYPRKTNKRISFNEAKEKYKSIFSSAVKLRMRSDVPVGFTLSSGIDSSSLVSILKDELKENNKTYTCSFSKTKFSSSEKQNFKNDIEINEPLLVGQLAEEIQLNSNIVEVDFDNYVNRLSKIIYHMESGHGSPAVFPLNSILETASKEVTVVLEGQGADELLGGYISNVQPVYILELLKKFKFISAFKEFLIFKKVYSVKSAFMLFVRDSNNGLIQKIFYKFNGIENFYQGKIKRYKHIKDFPIIAKDFDNNLNKYLFQAHTGGLVNLLHYGDAVSMKNSLESRLPFMDYRLVEFIFTLPSSYKVRHGLGKYIHREAMKGIVPDFILNNPIKFGFDSPLLHIFSIENKNSASSILLSDRCLQRGLFNKKSIIKALEEQKRKKKNYSRYLYRMLNVELWFREFID
jgi:asparagine synthase (glutamine-hydrolysing)